MPRLFSNITFLMSVEISEKPNKYKTKHIQIIFVKPKSNATEKTHDTTEIQNDPDLQFAKRRREREREKEFIKFHLEHRTSNKAKQHVVFFWIYTIQRDNFITLIRF